MNKQEKIAKLKAQIAALEAQPDREAVEIENLLVDNLMITEAFYAEVMGEEYTGDMPNHPKTRVTLDEMIEFCNARSVRDGLTPMYERIDGEWHCQVLGDGWRLPTDLEMLHYMTDGGKHDAPSPLEDYAVIGEPAPVGSKKPIANGIYDPVGLVYESGV